MKKIFLLFPLLLLLASLSVAQTPEPTPQASPKGILNLPKIEAAPFLFQTTFRLEELDGFPSIPAVSVLKVSNGTLTRNGSVGTLTIPTSSGDVVGPGSSTDNALVRFDGTTGKLIQNSLAILDDSGNISGLGTVASGAHTITSSSASCLSVGPNGDTNPVLRAVCNVASQSTGISVTGRASGAGADLTLIGGGTNENIRAVPKGTGFFTIQQPSGTPGTDEVGIKHDGSNAIYANLNDGAGTDYHRFTRSDGSTLARVISGSYFWPTTNRMALLSGFIGMGSGDAIYWNSNTDGTAGSGDTGLARGGVNSVRFTNGSTGAGSFIVGTSTVGSVGTSGVGVGVFANGTAPTSSPADEVQVYAADGAAGASEFNVRNEAGEINRLTGLASRNSAAFTATSSTTLTSITGIPRNVEAGRVYAFRGNFQTTANVAGGIQFSVSGTATATAISYEGTLQAAAALVNQTRATALDTAVCASTTTTAGTCRIEGVVQVANAGTLTINFAQSASNGAASTVLANQFFQLIPIN